MHAIFAVIGFQTLQTVFIGLLTKLHDLSAMANIAISYVSAAAIVSLVCWLWMWRNGLTILPKLPRLPVLRPIGWGLAVSCTAGFATTMLLRMYSVTPPLAAYAVEGNWSTHLTIGGACSASGSSPLRSSKSGLSAD